MSKDNVEVLWCGNGRGNGWKFPPAVRRRLITDHADLSVLHLFGGRSTFGTRMDFDPIVKPDVIADAWLPPFARDSFDVVMLDPPYIHLNCQAKTSLFKAAGWIARKRVVWFSTVWMAGSGGLDFDKGWLVRVGDSCHVRALQYFNVRADKRPPERHFTRGPAMKYNRWLAQPQALPGIYEAS